MLARPLLFLILGTLLGAGAALAQPAAAPIPRLQGSLSVGASTTLGDLESSLGLGPARITITGGLSSRLNRALAVDLTQSGAFGDDGSTEASTRWTTRLTTRLIWAQRSTSPYLLVGLNGTSIDAFAFGGTFGAGLDWAVSRQFDVFQQLTFDVPFAEVPPGSPVNAFGFFSAGLRIRIAPSNRPVRSLTVEIPDSVIVQQPATFTASADPGAARPITYTWIFDDGYMTTGEVATREFRYTRPYTATVVAENRDGQVSETHTLLVHPPPPEATDEPEPVVVEGVLTQPPQITEIYGRRTLQVGELENFRVRLDRGATGPIRYVWDFGDGILSVGNNVTHTYFEPGAYPVSVIARNVAGADTASAVVTVPAPQRPQPTPTPALGSDSTPPSGFGWVVGTFADRTEAETLAAKTRGAGRDTRVLTHEPFRRSTVYRVVVGRYGTEAAAERERARIQNLAAGPVWLLPFHGD